MEVFLEGAGFRSSGTYLPWVSPGFLWEREGLNNHTSIFSTLRDWIDVKITPLV